MAEGLTFRNFTKEDLTRISNFMKSVFAPDLSIRSHEPEYYEWKLYKNPVLHGEMWLAEVGNKIVGMKSITPKRMRVLGEILDAAEVGDTFTHPNYQRQGIFTTLVKAEREHGLDNRMKLIYGTPNQNALPGWLKQNYAQIPINLHRLVKPVYPKQLIETKLHFSPLASILCPLIEISSRAVFKISTIGMTKRDVFISQESSFPNDIDTLWEQASKDYEVIIVRTRDYLQWRYITNPDTYSILTARNKSGATSGYMVTKLTSSGDKKTGFVVDFLTIEDDPNIFSNLLAVSLEEFFQKKVNFVHVWTVKGSFYYKILLKFGFFPYDRVTLICYKNEIVDELLNKARKWHFTIGDSDNI